MIEGKRHLRIDEFICECLLERFFSSILFIINFFFYCRLACFDDDSSIEVLMIMKVFIIISILIIVYHISFFKDLVLNTSIETGWLCNNELIYSLR